MYRAQSFCVKYGSSSEDGDLKGWPRTPFKMSQASSDMPMLKWSVVVMCKKHHWSYKSGWIRLERQSISLQRSTVMVAKLMF